jgi:hypothetical protein
MFNPNIVSCINKIVDFSFSLNPESEIKTSPDVNVKLPAYAAEP